MQNNLVSIIIPVYNAAQYLEQCVLSVLNQTYQNIEVILVDDGSTDGSNVICKRYADFDCRVKYISQKKQGVVVARKRGVKLAAGQYVGFVDSDDYIDRDLYQKLMACREDFDLIVSQWFREDGVRIRRAYDRIAIGAYKSQADMAFLLNHLVNVSSAGGAKNIKSGFMTYMWTKLYKTALVREVFDDVDQTISFGEDIEFTYRYFLKCRSVLVTDICGYHYRVGNQSVSHSPDVGCRYIRNVCKLYETLLPVFAAHPQSSTLVPQLEFKISHMLEKAPQKMGFSVDIQRQKIVFPFLNLLDNKRVALYGAGWIGQAYWRQIHKQGICEIGLWVDEHYEQRRRIGLLQVSSIESLLDGGYEYIILAVECEKNAKEITDRLCNLGIPSDIILWREPFEL